MKYIETRKRRGALVTKGIVEINDTTIKTGPKYRSRKKILDDVFDLEDSVADNAKMISLLLTTLSRIYDIIPDTEKDNLVEADKAMIEYVFDKFKVTNTAADIKFATEGTNLLDRLLERQASVGSIIQEEA